MNEVYFACRTCKIFVDASYRWCYWTLEASGVVERGKPVNVSAVLNASEYWHGTEESAWLEELLPKVRAFLERNDEHDLVYGEGEDIGLVPMDDDYRFLDWMSETNDTFDLLPRAFIMKFGYGDWNQVTEHVSQLEQKPWWWIEPDLRQKAKEKFVSLLSC